MSKPVRQKGLDIPCYYAGSVVLSAFLLFQVQPMMGKYLLPWFGGTPAVWSTSLLFFQAVLTGGYAYAYWLLGKLSDRRQGVVHGIMLGLSIGLLLLTMLAWPSPLTPGAAWRPASSSVPIWGILRILAVAVGVPYLVLASNSTLMQAWSVRNQGNRTPYRMYALSNAGSLVALVSYPVLFEPMLTLRQQAYLWSFGYLVFALGAAYLALRTFRRTAVDTTPPAEGAQVAREPRPGRGVHLLWVGLAACASLLLLAVTNQITQEVAVIPFLWVLPLTVYLLTFILAFAGGRWYHRKPYLIALLVISVGSRMLLRLSGIDMASQIALYALLLFVVCMLCHNELYKLRPSARHLPSFYLMVSVGGALGGILVTLLAPLAFSTGFWELQWGLVLCGLLMAVVLQGERALPARQRSGKARGKATPARQRFTPAVMASSAAVLLASICVGYYMWSMSSETLLATRDFYGVNRVWEINADQPVILANQLTHGRTAHGFQFITSELRNLPTTYYAEKSGVGLAFANHSARPGPMRVGALGMGIGIIASYGQPGDVMRFYEINPNVIEIAEGQGGHFSFLTDSQADIQVIPGDARVSLERELAAGNPQNLDLLVLDTFLGDAMPLHLLTREAMELYLQHLRPGGVMAVNVSNRYFDLDLAVYRLADALSLPAVLVEDQGDGIQSYDSVWMLLSRDADFLASPAIVGRAAPRPAVPAGLRVWTDDYSNLFQYLK